MTFKTFITAVVMASVSGAAVLPAFAQEGPRDGTGAEMRGQGQMGPKFDFATVDADGDGKITKEEFDAQRAAKVAELDADKDGKISADELVALHMKGAQARSEMRAQRMIAAHDADGNGMLTAAELAVGGEPRDMFAKFDADGDGAVTQDEVEAMRADMRERMGGRGDRGGERSGKPWHKKGDQRDNG